jgi:ankyrin repeat protein
MQLVLNSKVESLHMWCCARSKSRDDEDTEERPSEQANVGAPKADVGAPDEQLAVMCADLKFGRVDTGAVARLLDGRADPNGRDMANNCALHYTCKVSSKDLEDIFVDATSLLLERKADADVQGWCDSTPLHMAASSGHAKIIELLVQHKASLEREDSNQHRPLHMAAVAGLVPALHLLLVSNADSMATDSRDRTALDLATENNNQAAVALLEQCIS